MDNTWISAIAVAYAGALVILANRITVSSRSSLDYEGKKQ